MYPWRAKLPLAKRSAEEAMVAGSQSRGLLGRFAACPLRSAHSRTLIATIPLGNPAASSALRFSVELGATERSTTWWLARGAVATAPLGVSFNVTVPLVSGVALACEENTPTTTDVTTNTAPRSWSTRGIRLPGEDPGWLLRGGVEGCCRTIVTTRSVALI